MPMEVREVNIVYMGVPGIGCPDFFIPVYEFILGDPLSRQFVPALRDEYILPE